MSNYRNEVVALIKETFKLGTTVRKVKGKKLAKVVEVKDNYPNSSSHLSFYITLEWWDTKRRERIYIGSQATAQEWVNMDAIQKSQERWYVLSSEDTWTEVTLKMKVNDKQWVVQVKGSEEQLVVSPTVIKIIRPNIIKVNIGERDVRYYTAPKGLYKKDEIYLLGQTLKLARILEADLDKVSGVVQGDFKPLGKLAIEYNTYAE